jgi:hypothetical protein
MSLCLKCTGPIVCRTTALHHNQTGRMIDKKDNNKDNNRNGSLTVERKFDRQIFTSVSKPDL